MLHCHSWIIFVYVFCWRLAKMSEVAHRENSFNLVCDSLLFLVYCLFYLFLRFGVWFWGVWMEYSSTVAMSVWLVLHISETKLDGATVAQIVAQIVLLLENQQFKSWQVQSVVGSFGKTPHHIAYVCTQNNFQYKHMWIFSVSRNCPLLQCLKVMDWTGLIELRTFCFDLQNLYDLMS